MLSFIDSRCLPLLDAEAAPRTLLGLAVVPTADARRYGSVDVTLMRFSRWTRADGAALFLWEECWIGTPTNVGGYLDRVVAATDDALIVGHDLFEYAYPVLESTGADLAPMVDRTVDLAMEIATKVAQDNPYVTYHSALGENARVNSDGRLGPVPTTAFEERFADVGEAWRRGMWEASLSCWLWARIIADGEIGLPPVGDSRVRFAEEDFDVLLAARPRFDATIWGLRRMLDDRQSAA